MADRRQRSLERQAALGDVDAEATFLVERVRAGALAIEPIEWADFLGHPQARQALERLAPPAQRPKKAGKRGDRRRPKALRTRRGDAPLEAADPEQGSMWVLCLEGWSREACVRAAVAAGRLAITALGQDSPRADLAEQALQAAEGWVLSPTLEHELTAQDRADTIVPALGGPPEHVLWCAKWAAAGAGSDVSALGPGLAFFGGDEAAARAAGAGEAALGSVHHALHAGIAHAALLEAVQAELVPWALGSGDPVRERVAERGEIEIVSDDLT